MKVTLWGTRGSISTPGPETARYGGNTSCVEVRGADGTLLVLDAGTGIRRLGATLMPDLTPRRIDILLTHLHMDHIQGLGFFAPLLEPGVPVHIWGPASTTLDLRGRLARYLSPPLFPVHLRDVPDLRLHEVPCGPIEIGPFMVSAAFVCHPNPTVGYRIEEAGAVLTYLPDHEPALGLHGPLLAGGWTSGCALAAGADLLIHDAQYSEEEYARCIGWGHSAWSRTFEFASLAGVRTLVPFHHDPAHDDQRLDELLAYWDRARPWPFSVAAGCEGATFALAR